MQKLSSRRSTFLSFQPPAVGPEEVAAVTETLTSGWLTSGPRGALAPALARSFRRGHSGRDRRAPSRPRGLHPVTLSRPLRVGLQVLVSAGVLVFLLWQIDVGRTLDLIRSSNGFDLLAAYVIFLLT